MPRDLREPPPVAPGLRVSMLHSDGDRRAHSYQRDGGEGAVWDVEVAADADLLAEGAVTAAFTLSASGELPAGYRLHVFDTAASVPLNAEGLALRLTPDEPVRRLRVVVGTEELARASLGAPEAFALLPAYPNPSQGAVTLAYQLAERAPVTLEVIDVLGRRVAVLVSEEQEPGHYAVRWAPRGLAAGTYLYRLRAGEQAATRRLQIIR